MPNERAWETGKVVVLLVTTLLVDKMTILVDSASNTLLKVIDDVAGGHTNIRRTGTTGERVSRDIEATSVSVESNLLGNVGRELDLFLDVPVTANVAVVMVRVLGFDLFDQGMIFFKSENKTCKCSSLKPAS